MAQGSTGHPLKTRKSHFREGFCFVGSIDDGHASGGRADFLEAGWINWRVNNEFHRTFSRARLSHFTVLCAYSTTLQEKHSSGSSYVFQ